MSETLIMSCELFDSWIYQLVDKEAYAAAAWKRIGISNEYCNQISEPEFGLTLINWYDREFKVVDQNKYLVFLLKYDDA